MSLRGFLVLLVLIEGAAIVFWLATARPRSFEETFQVKRDPERGITCFKQTGTRGGWSCVKEGE